MRPLLKRSVHMDEDCGGDQSLLGGGKSFRHGFIPSEQLWRTFKGGCERFEGCLAGNYVLKVHHT